MGNTPSSEVPRGSPHKLLKPRPASLAIDLVENLSLDGDDVSSPASSRYGYTYLAGSRRTMSFQQLPCPPHDGHSLYRQPSLASVSPRAPRSPWRQPEPLDATVWSPMPESHTSAPAPSTPHTDRSNMRSHLARAKSVAYPSSCASQSMSRRYSCHSNAYLPINSRAQPSTPVTERRRYSVMGSIRIPDDQGETEMLHCPIGDALGVHVQDTDAFARPGLQERSRSTPYVPMRRRSVIQVPGVATRAIMDHPPLPTKPAFHTNHFSPVVYSTGDSTPYSNSSVSPNSSKPELQERSVTPCDADYQQLGTIKFGTLRITNGSPVPGAAVDSSDWIAQAAPLPNDFGLRASCVPDGPAWPLRNMVVTNPDPGVGVGSGFHPSQVSPSGGWSTVTCNASAGDVGQEHKPESTPRLPPDGSAGSPDRQIAPCPDEEAEWSTRPIEYISPEIITVRIEPPAIHQDSNATSDSSNNSQNGSVGSDSGFIASSTSSRQSSQRTLSKADSGYSSNFSLRSMRSNSSKSHAQKTEPATEPAPPEDRVQQPKADDDDASRPTNQHSPSLPRNSFALISRVTLRRLSTRASKIPKSPPQPVADQISGSVATGTVMRRATMTDVRTEAPWNGLERQESPSKQGKLQRFLGSARRQSRVISSAFPQQAPDPVPMIPVNLEKTFLESDGQLQGPPHARYPRKNLPQQPPAPAWNGEVAEAVRGKPDARHPPTRPRGQASFPATAIPPYSPPSYTERPPMDHSLPSTNQFGSRPLSGMTRLTRNRQTHQAELNDVALESRVAERHEEMREFRAPTSKTPINEAAAGSPARARRTLTKLHLQAPARSTPTSALKTRASAPTLMATSSKIPHPLLPTSPSRSSNNPAQAQPSRLRAGSVRTARDLLPSQASSSTPEEVTQSPSQKRSMESLSRCPSSTKGANTVSSGEPPQSCHIYSVHGRHPPVVYRQPRPRQALEIHGQSYRILHSYNSPAYKNVPIWG